MAIVAGLNVEKHKMAMDDPIAALSSLGVRYFGNGNWKLPPGGKAEFVGHDRYSVVPYPNPRNNSHYEEDDDWVLYIEGVKYYVWTSE